MAFACSIFAATALAGPGLQVLASAAVGGALLVFAWWVISVLQTEDLQQGVEWRYDISRINELRRVSLGYRFFQPAIRLLGKLNRLSLREALPEIQRQIQAAGLPRFWLAEEYLAWLELLAAFITPLYVYLFVAMFDLSGLLPAMAAFLLTVYVLRVRLAHKAALRLRTIKRRMPFLLDLLTLLMEAGSTFLNALTQAVDEFQGHPVAEEFGRVLTDMRLGKTRAEAFIAMRERLSDGEITSIIGSRLQGEELGTPLA